MNKSIKIREGAKREIRKFISQEVGALLVGVRVMRGMVAVARGEIISSVVILEYEFKEPHPRPEIVRYIAWATNDKYRCRGLARTLGFKLREERPGDDVGDLYAWGKD